jgi:hypothetical protein
MRPYGINETKLKKMFPQGLGTYPHLGSRPVRRAVRITNLSPEKSDSVAELAVQHRSAPPEHRSRG